jgi:ParB family transcriptional regulator, chromosome partitioning protein
MATTLKDRLARQASGNLTVPFDLPNQDEPRLQNVPLDSIEPDPKQPRKDLGDVTELADSIREHGLLQPMIVEPIDFNKYRILAGERRYAACKHAGLQTAPCLVRTVEEHSRLAMQLIENLHRKPLTPMEEAAAFQRLLEEFNLTQRELAQRLGKSLTSVNQTLRLLDINPELQTVIQTSEQPSKSVLLEIAKEPDPQRQIVLLEEAKTTGLTVRTAKERKQATRPNQSQKGLAVRNIVLAQATVTVRFRSGPRSQDALVAALEEALSQSRGTCPQSSGNPTA